MIFEEFLRNYGSFLLAAASLAWAIGSTRGKAKKEEQDKLESRVAAVEKDTGDAKNIGTRVVTLETGRVNDLDITREALGQLRERIKSVEDELEHMPTKDQVHGLQLSLTEMKGDFRELATSIKPLASSVERIDDFLMGQGQRRGSGQ